MQAPASATTPGPVHLARPETATVVSVTPAIGPEVYQMIRSQVSEEIKRQLRAEFDSERKRITAKTEVFTRTVQSQLEELVAKLGAAETSMADIASSLKNASFRLKQAADGLESGPGA